MYVCMYVEKKTTKNIITALHLFRRHSQPSVYVAIVGRLARVLRHFNHANIGYIMPEIFKAT